MKELLKVVAKKLFIWSIIVNTIYSLADYGEAFALSYFGTSPLTLDKIIKLTICIFIVGVRIDIWTHLMRGCIMKLCILT